jgi:hypothetical protein
VDAEAAGFAQAIIACEAATSRPHVRPAVDQGRLEIVLGDGIRVIVDQEVDAGAVARLIGALERR